MLTAAAIVCVYMKSRRTNDDDSVGGGGRSLVGARAVVRKQLGEHAPTMNQMSGCDPDRVGRATTRYYRDAPALSLVRRPPLGLERRYLRQRLGERGLLAPPRWKEVKKCAPPRRPPRESPLLSQKKRRRRRLSGINHDPGQRAIANSGARKPAALPRFSRHVGGQLRPSADN
uniref:Uncharacterized protein n=1 Tax=Plectus sambesii TaxID=2011161 RepID=A0A914VRB1_9BILA